VLRAELREGVPRGGGGGRQVASHDGQQLAAHTPGSARVPALGVVSGGGGGELRLKIESAVDAHMRLGLR
jgi:hypothetical protein